MRAEGRLFVSNTLCERTTPPMNLIDQIISTIELWQKHLLMTSPQDQSGSMADMEQAAQALGKRIAQLALSHLLEQSGTGYDRSTRSCHLRRQTEIRAILSKNPEDFNRAGNL